MNRPALKNEVYMKTCYSQYKESILKRIIQYLLTERFIALLI